MAFLTPLFLLGLGALAIPVLVHLIQREKKRVVVFPSLMFVRRIPYQSVRRRRIRHWALLILRAAAVAIIVAAFARPFLRRSATATAFRGASREVVILLDQSASMGYGDHWRRAQDAARSVVRGLGADDRATLVLFAKNAEENMRATPDHVRLEAAIGAAKVTSGATRFGPAIKLAESILGRSTRQRREAVLISDFQKSGWSGSEDARFPDGMTLTPVSIVDNKPANLSVPSVTFARANFSGQERVTVTAGLSNKGEETVREVPVVLSVDGHEIETRRASVGGRTTGSVAFTPFTLAGANVRGTVQAGTDPMPADNQFFFVLSPSAPVSVGIIDNGTAEASMFLAKALAIGTAPTFHVDVVPASRATPSTFDKRAVVILNDTMFPPAASGGALRRFVENGGGLLIIAGERTTWTTGDAQLLPGKLGPPVDRMSGRSASLGYLDYSHPMLEIFKAPRSGDFSAAHMFRYRSLEPGPNDRVLARYDDGGAAAVERRVGSGRVIVWTSTLDDTWTDIAVKPVFLPLVHRMVRYLAHYEEPESWLTVGQAIDLTSRGGPASTNGNRSNKVVVITPGGQRVTPLAGEDDPRAVIELAEQGIYELRTAGVATAGRPESVAVNLDPAESDLSPMDPRELVAAVTGKASSTSVAADAPREATREDTERSQSLWWYLLLAGLLLLTAESIISNRLSRTEKFL